MALDRDQLGMSSEPLGREDEALLAAVDVSSLDKQEGYDVSLLALQPRDVRPSPSSSPPADPHASFRSHDSPPLLDTLHDPTTATYPSGVPSSFSHPSRDHDDESAPLDPSSTSRTSSDHRRFRQSAVPPLSASYPRRAAHAYSERARAAERQRRSGGGALEKGGSAPAREGRRALWQRKGLVFGLALVILLVCAGIGIGLGVTLSGSVGGGEKGDGLEAVPAATATASASGPSVADVEHELQPSMAPTMMPTAAPSIVEAEEDSAAPVPAPTHSAGETAPVPTGAAASSVPSWEAEESWSDGTEG
ncbi:hypothetical protein JCM9279_002560 [Rhodotorula babjevae]